MFKNCKENQCLSRQMIDFFNRQFSLLKDLANKCSQLAYEITADQIKESVQLMEKRIVFVLDQKSSEQFHDYVSDFYEDKLQKMRKELNKQIMRNKQLEGRVEELGKQIRNKDDIMLKTKPVDLATVHQNVTLKNQLIHSQKLIKDNQIVMDQQNTIIQELTVFVQKIEDRQKQGRLRVDQKIRQMDQVIASKKRSIVDLTREFQLQNKRMERELRELQLMNISLIGEKDKLESQIVMKSQEIKLLTKKIYDNTLIINKFQRAFQQNEGILLEQKIENNRSIDYNKMLKDKLKEIQKQYEEKLANKAKEIKELEDKNMKLGSSNKELEIACMKHVNYQQKNSSQFRNRGEEVRKLEDQLHTAEIKIKQYEKDIKKIERKDKENSLKIKQFEELLQEKEEECGKYKDIIARLKKDLQSNVQTYERQKEIIKNDIESEFINLVSINKESLQQLASRQSQINQLNKQIDEMTIQNRKISDNYGQLSLSFEQAKRMMNKIEQQKQDVQYVKEQLQIKFKHAERKAQELTKIQQDRNQLKIQNIQLQELCSSNKRIIKQREIEIEKIRSNINEQGSRASSIQKNQIRTNKQQLCKKDFQIKQLNSKINILQQQLRQADRTHHQQRQKMNQKIRQLQEIIQDRFDLTNRLIDSSIL